MDMAAPSTSSTTTSPSASGRAPAAGRSTAGSTRSGSATRFCPRASSSAPCRSRRPWPPFSWAPACSTSAAAVSGP